MFEFIPKSINITPENRKVNIKRLAKLTLGGNEKQPLKNYDKLPLTTMQEDMRGTLVDNCTEVKDMIEEKQLIPNKKSEKTLVATTDISRGSIMGSYFG